MTTVKDLMTVLKQCPPDSQMIMAETESGGSFHLLTEMDVFLTSKTVIMWPGGPDLDVMQLTEKKGDD